MKLIPQVDLDLAIQDPGFDVSQDRRRAIVEHLQLTPDLEPTVKNLLLYGSKREKPFVEVIVGLAPMPSTKKPEPTTTQNPPASKPAKPTRKKKNA